MILVTKEITSVSCYNKNITITLIRDWYLIYKSLFCWTIQLTVSSNSTMIPVTVLLQVIFAIQHTFAACPESLEGLTKWSELTTVGLEYNMFDKNILTNIWMLKVTPVLMKIVTLILGGISWRWYTNYGTHPIRYRNRETSFCLDRKRWKTGFRPNSIFG